MASLDGGYRAGAASLGASLYTPTPAAGTNGNGAASTATEEELAPWQRKTKIVCTIGPVTAGREALFALADAGMNVARCAAQHMRCSGGTGPRHGAPLPRARAPGGAPGAARGADCADTLPQRRRAAADQHRARRLNFSHGEFAWHAGIIALVKEYNAMGKGPVAIMLDTKGAASRACALPRVRPPG